MSEYKKNMKKFDYQQRARDTLLRIENIIISKKQDQCFDLIAEFIFLEKQSHDQRKSSYSGSGSANKNQLNLCQEFQLVVVLCEFFSRNSQEVIKNAIFLSLFGGSTTPYPRSRVLVKLISTAISGSIAPILRAAGTWMQQLGPTSQPCLELAHHLIQDFIIFSKRCTDQLKTIPTVAPRFAINLMTAMADLYLNDCKNSDVNRQITVPPDTLLDVVTEWVSDNPSLCLTNQPPLALPPGAISMPLVAPLAGLIRWCVLAPLFLDKESISYNKLHLALLQSLSQNQPTTSALNALHLGSIIITLKSKAEKMTENGMQIDTDERMQCSLERFAQSIQLALSEQAISGNVNQLVCRLETLPRNVLLQMVIKAQKVTI